MNGTNTVSTHAMPRIGLFLLVGVAVSGCTAYSSTSGSSTNAGPCKAPADHEITVLFDVSGCPSDVEVAVGSRCGVDQRCVRATKATRMIRWRADKAGVQFGIFFDPLVGPQYISQGGCIRKAISSKAPPVDGQDPLEYKYAVVTMLSVNEIDPNCNALDPKVIVEH